MISDMEQEDEDESGEDRRLYIKEEDDEKDYENTFNSTGNSTRLSDLHNTTVKSEMDSDEEMPLVRLETRDVRLFSVSCLLW